MSKNKYAVIEESFDGSFIQLLVEVTDNFAEAISAAHLYMSELMESRGEREIRSDRY